ncbi:MAG: hypothetical protein LBL96_07845 [Clostridiales bacterium]|nr:hypothetical protein [Clostridiales bacterium]
MAIGTALVIDGALSASVAVSNLDDDLNKLAMMRSPSNYENSDITIAGKGSSGRVEAQSLKEEIAMKQVISNPLKGAKPLDIIMTDIRWLAKDGWIKMSQNVNGVEIHFLYNTITKVFDDFKFK